MNEKSLQQTWQTFAKEYKLEFSFDDRPNIQGVTTEYLLKIDAKTILKARIGKTGSYHQLSCKLFLEGISHQLKDQTIKASSFWSFKRNDFEKSVSHFLKKTDSNELKIQKGRITLEFNTIIETTSQLISVLTMAKQIEETLKPI